MQKYYDIVIAGGGMIGSVLASKLACNPVLRDLSILMIESTPKKAWADVLLKRADGYSNRVSTLNNNTKSLLQQIDVWDTISTVSCREVKDMKVWSHASKQISTTFRADDLSNSEALAYVVENEVLIAAAMMQLNKLNERVYVLHNSSVIDYTLPGKSEEKNDNVVLRLKDGSCLECSLLLGSDGVNSMIRKILGVQYLAWKYNQAAVVATLKIRTEKENYTAWQKFLSEGPVALLPLSDEYSSLVWTTTPERAKSLLSLTNESFVDALNTVLWEDPIENPLVNTISNALDSLLNAAQITTRKEGVIPPTISGILEKSRASFPVGFGHATCYAASRVALLGDSAHRVHPLAGLGVNLGFGDIECLDRVLTRSTLCGAELGDFDYLREYETERQKCNVPKLIGIDVIQKVTGHSWSPFLAITNAGLQITNSVPQLKKIFVKLAST